MVIDFSSFYSFPRQIDRIFEELSGPYYPGKSGISYPPLHLSEDEESFIVRAEIPGVAMGEIELTLTEKTLVMKGERKVEKGKYYRQERPTGAFQRVISINAPVDREQAKATLVDGVLTVVLPKAEHVKPKKINIDLA